MISGTHATKHTDDDRTIRAGAIAAVVNDANTGLYLTMKSRIHGTNLVTLLHMVEELPGLGDDYRLLSRTFRRNRPGNKNAYRVIILSLLSGLIALSFPFPLLLRRDDCSSWLFATATAFSWSTNTPPIRTKTPLPQPPSELLKMMIQDARTKHQPAVPLWGVYDALSATILSQHLHSSSTTSTNSTPSAALFLSGFGVAASRLGQPDAGIVTRSELEDSARTILDIAKRYSVPVIVDGDTGFGGPSNLRTLIRSMATMGAAAISIEDQQFPKRCAYVAGSSINVLTRSEAQSRIRTALRAQQEAYQIDGHPILLIARTDCRMALGFSEVKERCLLFEEMGADIVYAEHLQGEDEYRQLRAAMSPETCMMIAQVQKKTEGEASATLWNTTQIRTMGYDMALFGITALQSTVATLQQTARDLMTHQGIIPRDGPTLSSLDEVKQVVGFSELIHFETEYGCQ